MANKPVLFAVDDPDVLRAVERNLRRKYGRSRNRDGYDILEPFLTTKGVGEYTGSGLDVVRASSRATEVRSASIPSPERRAARYDCP